MNGHSVVAGVLNRDVSLAVFASVSYELERVSDVPLDMCSAQDHVSYGPCVDGSELARTFFTFAALVGAAMCSAC